MTVFQHGFNFDEMDITPSASSINVKAPNGSVANIAPQKTDLPNDQTEGNWPLDSLVPPVTLIKQFLSAKQQQLMINEVASYPLERVEIEVYGKKHLIPRTQAWFGDAGCDYRFSKVQISPLPWPAILSKLRNKLRVEHHFDSNAVLVNYYANGHDCMGWHSDDEPEIATGSAIASVTLGATRDFVVRHKPSQTKVKFSLGGGDLLIMHAGMQQVWQHALPKRLKVTEPRVNFTFRQIVPNFYS